MICQRGIPELYRPEPAEIFPPPGLGALADSAAASMKECRNYFVDGLISMTNSRAGVLCVALGLAPLFGSPTAVADPSANDAKASAAVARPTAMKGWFEPGKGGVLPANVTYDNEHGRLGVLNKAGPIKTAGHAFFEPIGTNGRACVTCHQPKDGMSVSVASIKERWAATGGTDPIFAAVDGSNCPDLPQQEAASHSLLLNRGLFRIALPWPPKGEDGKPIATEFDIQVVRDPTGCNTSSKYGLNSAKPTISVYRRPRIVANTKYLTEESFGISPFSSKSALPTARDPETGRPVNMNMMADARYPTLKTQATAAAFDHLQTKAPLSDAQLAQITSFEAQIYSAQIFSNAAGSLDEPKGPPALGPLNVSNARPGVLGMNTLVGVFPMGESWKQLPRDEDPKKDAANSMRASIARGGDVFMFRTFFIRDTMHINTIGLGNPTKRTCSTCHGMHMTGMDLSNGWIDIGTTNLPWASEVPLNPWETRRPDMPLFKITCSRSYAPHPFFGRTIYTQDPGRALISGKCNDVGTIVMQQMRGLAARAPYFANGSAATLRDVVDFYDRRYGIGFTAEEKQDLANFLSVL